MHVCPGETSPVVSSRAACLFFRGVFYEGSLYGSWGSLPQKGGTVKAGFILMGVCVLVIGVVLSQWFMGKTRPEDYGLLPDGGGGTEQGGAPTSDGGARLGPSLRKVLRDSRFWILVVCYSLAVMAEMSALIHYVPYAFLLQQLE